MHVDFVFFGLNSSYSLGQTNFRTHSTCLYNRYLQRDVTFCHFLERLNKTKTLAPYIQEYLNETMVPTAL